MGVALLFIAARAASPASARAQSVSDEDVRNELSRVAAQAQGARGDLSSLSAAGLTGSECQGVEGVPASELRQAYLKFRDQVLNRLSDRRLAALRAWMEEQLPAEPTAADPTLARCFSVPVVRKQRAEEQLSAVSDAAREVAERSLTLTLRFITEPIDHARVRLRPLRYTETVVDDLSNTDRHTLYRGLYLMTVERDGYNPVREQRLVLTDPRSKAVSCHLELAASGRTSACGPRERP